MDSKVSKTNQASDLKIVSDDIKWVKPELKLLDDHLIDGKLSSTDNEVTPSFGPS